MSPSGCCLVDCHRCIIIATRIMPRKRTRHACYCVREKEIVDSVVQSVTRFRRLKPHTHYASTRAFSPSISSLGLLWRQLFSSPSLSPASEHPTAPCDQQEFISPYTSQTHSFKMSFVFFYFDSFYFPHFVFLFFFTLGKRKIISI